MRYNQKRQVEESEIPPFAMCREEESKRPERGEGEKGELLLENVSPEVWSCADAIKMPFHHGSCLLPLKGETNKLAATPSSMCKLLKLVSVPEDVRI